MLRTLFSLIVAALAFSIVIAANAATVTLAYTPGLVRSQVQGAGTYDALDFFYSNAPGAQFLNYRLIVSLTSGSIADPARLQDDRQYDSTNESNTAGSVDTWANTVWSAVGKDDLGYNASYNFNSSSYNPSGSGAAPTTPPITFLDWSVFDTFTEDDNDLNDANTNGPVDETAPYHIARVLVLPGSTGGVEFRAFDTSQVGVPQIFSGFISGDGFLNVDDITLAGGRGGRLFTAGPLPTNDDDVPDQVSWELESFTGPGGPVAGASVDPLTGIFTWQSPQQIRNGTYTAAIRGTNDRGQTTPIGTDLGYLTFRAIGRLPDVPEPATASLFGLAMFGALGFTRRR
jgi:hypothetical protein